MIQGINGRMGHVLQERIAARKDCRIVAGIDRAPGEPRDFPVYTAFSEAEVSALASVKAYADISKAKVTLNNYQNYRTKGGDY